ncbi:hypothetical protein J2128_002470 [Methanomicrobium sp. W14]|uniref:gasdermin n=1 Tax=Methanomicrobium sp. W14 TaxID=2817839 RepID=UPI001AE5DB50|nr:hypothetical protein [Methanomicrobium sp. W14]MBP2134504.1 hypothetical protein [Methanomicrobium sp. W14]
MFEDPLIEKINNDGYIGVKIPRTNLNPLSLLIKKWRKYEFSSAELNSILREKNECTLPKSKPFSLPQMNGEIISKYGFGFGISFFKEFLNLMGLPSASVESTFKNVTKLEYAFTNIKGKEIDDAKLDRYLKCSDSIYPVPTYKIDLEKDKICIITSVIYCNELLINAYDKNNVSIDLETPLMKGLSDVKLDFLLESTEKEQIKIQRKKQFYAFGLKAARLFYEDEKYTRFSRITEGIVKGVNDDMKIDTCVVRPNPDENIVNEWLCPNDNIIIE